MKEGRAEEREDSKKEEFGREVLFWLLLKGRVAISLGNQRALLVSLLGLHFPVRMA